VLELFRARPGRQPVPCGCGWLWLPPPPSSRHRAIFKAQQCPPATGSGLPRRRHRCRGHHPLGCQQPLGDSATIQVIHWEPVTALFGFAHHEANLPCPWRCGPRRRRSAGPFVAQAASRWLVRQPARGRFRFAVLARPVGRSDWVAAWCSSSSRASRSAGKTRPGRLDLTRPSTVSTPPESVAATSTATGYPCGQRANQGTIRRARSGLSAFRQWARS